MAVGVTMFRTTDGQAVLGGTYSTRAAPMAAQANPGDGWRSDKAWAAKKRGQPKPRSDDGLTSYVEHATLGHARQGKPRPRHAVRRSSGRIDGPDRP